MTLLARTTKQQARDQRDKKVAAAFLEYRKAFPHASTAAIARTITESGDFGLSFHAIQKILYRTGAITPKSRA